jgi:hypothetical protein
LRTPSLPGATTCTRPIAELKETPAETGVMVDGGKGQPVANGVLAALVAHRTLADQFGSGARTADRGRGLWDVGVQPRVSRRSSRSGARLKAAAVFARCVRTWRCPMARRHDDDDDLCRFERLNAVRALSGRPPIPPQRGGIAGPSTSMPSLRHVCRRWIFWGRCFRIEAMTTKRSRPLDRAISRQTFLRGGLGMLTTGAVFGTTPSCARSKAPQAAANLSDLWAVFSPEWTSPAVTNAHFNTMSTPHGPGWTFACADTDLTPWSDHAKGILARYWPETIGTEVQWTFYLNVPTQTILPDWFCGLLWEFHTNAWPGHNLEIDVTQTPQPCFKIMRDTGEGSTPTYTSPLTFDHWYKVIVQVKWSLGSDGYIRWFIDGTKWLDYSGATCFPGAGDPFLQFGYYSSIGAGTNYSHSGRALVELRTEASAQVTVFDTLESGERENLAG